VKLSLRALGARASLVSGLLLAGCASSAPLPPKAIELNQSGAAALAAGDLTTAEARIGLALEYNDRFVEAWVNYGLIELRRGNFREAEKHFKRARDINPDLPTPHHGLGLLFDKRGVPKEAEKNYREALKVDPGFTASRVNLGKDLFADGRFDEAQEQYLRLTQVAPETLEGWLGLVECLWQLERGKDAGIVLENAHRIFGDGVPELQMLLGRHLLREDKYEAAEGLFANLTTHADPSRRAHAWSWIAFARIGMSDPDGAVRAASEALKIDRDQSVATYAMGLALRMKGSPEAEGWLERSHQLSPRNAAVAPKEGGP
jgi:tetratricopeptide (TPR) repeat protein